MRVGQSYVIIYQVIYIMIFSRLNYQDRFSFRKETAARLQENTNRKTNKMSIAHM